MIFIKLFPKYLAKFLSFLYIYITATSSLGMELQPKQFFVVENDVQIDLYTLKNPTEPQILVINDTNSIKESNFNPEVPTRIFIHGFQSEGELRDSLTDGNYKNELNESIKVYFYRFSFLAYFIKGKKNINLIGVNWEKASRTFNYVAASGYVKQIGARAAEFVDFMVILMLKTWIK